MGWSRVGDDDISFNSLNNWKLGGFYLNKVINA
jgi:hypothetical protein